MSEQITAPIQSQLPLITRRVDREATPFPSAPQREKTDSAPRKASPAYEAGAIKMHAPSEQQRPSSGGQFRCHGATSRTQSRGRTKEKSPGASRAITARPPFQATKVLNHGRAREHEKYKKQRNTKEPDGDSSSVFSLLLLSPSPQGVPALGSRSSKGRLFPLFSAVMAPR